VADDPNDEFPLFAVIIPVVLLILAVPLFCCCVLPFLLRSMPMGDLGGGRRPPAQAAPGPRDAVVAPPPVQPRP
jgi:hypothetical protein